jgi:hypothetical protein
MENRDQLGVDDSAVTGLLRPGGRRGTAAVLEAPELPPPKFVVKGESLTRKLWLSILDSAVKKGLNLEGEGYSFSKDKVPKDLGKTTHMHAMLQLLIDNNPEDMGVKGAYDWLSRLYDTGKISGGIGKAKVTRNDKFETAKVKQSGLFVGRSKPVPTMLAKNYNQKELKDYFDKVREGMSRLSWSGSLMKKDLMEEWNLDKVHGFYNDWFLLGHALTTVSGDVPWTQGVAPVPERAMDFGASQVLRKELKASNTPGSLLKPAHCLNGSMGASVDYEKGLGASRYANKGGAAGFPWTNTPNARELTSDGRRPTKANVAKEDSLHIQNWLIAGMPMSGDLYDKIAQPASLWYRGDATADIYVLALAHVLREMGDPRLLWLLGGRGIIIVASRLIALENIVSQPLQAVVPSRDVTAFDLRSRRTTQRTMSGFVSRALSLGESILGLDATRWDWGSTPQDHAYDAAIAMALYPDEEVSVLVGGAMYPAEWKAELIEEMLRDIPPGDTRTYSVSGPDPEGGRDWVDQVDVMHARINMHELIPKLVTMVNGPMIYGDFVLEGDRHRTTVPMHVSNWGAGSKPRFVETMGGRRSGSAWTGLFNTINNGVVTWAGSYVLSKAGHFNKMLSKRANAMNFPIPVEVSGQFTSSVRRGDDQVVSSTFKMNDSDGNPIHDSVIGGLSYAISGRYANPAKQETSGNPGVPYFGFASKMYDEVFAEGITPPERSIVRSLTSEGAGLPTDELTPMDASEKDLELGQISSTLTAIARILPQRGGPMGSETPGSADLVLSLADLDKFKLAYSNFKDLTLDQIQAIKLAEARRWARREAVKHGLTEDDLKLVEREYLDADVHVLLRQHADESGTGSPLKREPDAYVKGFEAIQDAMKRS